MSRNSALLLRTIPIISLSCLFLFGCGKENAPQINQSPNSFDDLSEPICYLVSENDSWKIRSLDPATNNDFLIADIGGARVGGLAWSPDRTSIAFASDRSGLMEIWVVNNDGSELHQVTGISKILDNGRCYDPAWADNKNLVYTQLLIDSGRCELAQIHVDGTQQRSLVIYEGTQYCYSAPCLLIDGGLMACNFGVPIDTTQSGILVVNFPGFGNKHIVSVPGQKACNPKWSATGVIAFDDISSGIYTVLSSGAQLTNISGVYHATDRFPSFSVDGGQIAFLSDESGINNIWIMNVDGANRQQKTSESSENIIAYLDW
jgi:Tol biopolymer transport system component